MARDGDQLQQEQEQEQGASSHPKDMRCIAGWLLLFLILNPPLLRLWICVGVALTCD